MSCSSLLRSGCGSVTRVGSCSSSVSSVRCLSSSSADFATKVRQVAKVKGPPVQKQSGPRNRRRNTVYQFDKTAIPHVNLEPVSLRQFPLFPPQKAHARPDFTRELAIGKVHIDANSRQAMNWGDWTNQAVDISPMTVPRALTFDLMDRLHAVRDRSKADKPEKHSNLMLWGNSGSGKTHLLAQMHSIASNAKFITILIPSAIRHVSWNYPYHYSEKTKTFHQPTLACYLLDRINFGNNRDRLSKHKVAKGHSYTFSPDLAPGVGGSKKPVDIQFKGETLADLCTFGAKEPAVSTEVLELVLDQLRAQRRHPVLLVIDHAQAYFRKTKYMTPELNVLEPYHLSVPRMFLDILSGRKQFERGLTLSACTPIDAAYRVSPELLHGVGLPTNENVLGPYGTYSKQNFPMDPNYKLQPHHVKNASDFELVHVPEGLTLAEAKGLWEAKAARRTLHTVNSDDNFLAKYIEVHGNPRELFRAIDLSTA